MDPAPNVTQLRPHERTYVEGARNDASRRRSALDPFTLQATRPIRRRLTLTSPIRARSILDPARQIGGLSCPMSRITHKAGLRSSRTLIYFPSRQRPKREGTMKSL